MANLDDDAWNCPKHPSRRHRIGVCPICLHDRLASLCPDCSHALPCACAALSAANFSASSSTSSSSSSFSLVSNSVSIPGDFRSVGRVASLISSEPAFRKSRSVAVPCEDPDLNSGRRIHRGNGNPFWRLFKSRRGENGETEEKQRKEMMMMRKSRSVAAGDSPEKTTARGKSWYFPSPIKAFRQSRVSRMVFHLRSPLYRG